MPRYVLNFEAIDRTQTALVGGKAANLGELTRIGELNVPPGFCVTTDAFAHALETSSNRDALNAQLDQLAAIANDDVTTVRALSADIRASIESIEIPIEIVNAIVAQLETFGANHAYAVRSSATAEDMPTASFAGQQDTYLNVIGADSVLEYVRKCWASLFTERAVVYRTRADIDHRKVRMAVVVQQMIAPQASGILFTADPINGNRRVSSIDASFGLGEALVAGIVNPDLYKVRDGVVTDRVIAAKTVVITATSGGGTARATVETSEQSSPALTDSQAIELAALGRRIEAHFGNPQDIEWCVADGQFYILQSRPITTLFPLPDINDSEPHVYVSVGHQQMMTDAMKPLGISFWQLTTPRPMAVAGGRLFVDVAPMLAVPASRAAIMGTLGKSDPLIGDALTTLVNRGFVPITEPGAFHEAASKSPSPTVRSMAGQPAGVTPPPIATDSRIVSDLIARNDAAADAARSEIENKSGVELIDAILADITAMKRILFDPISHQAIMASVETSLWLNTHLQEWLGEKNLADTFAQSAPNNVTSEMGLALLDVADAFRPHPELVQFLEHVARDGVSSDVFLRELESFAHGHEARAALNQWLDRYGVRGTGEIDITRTRWREQPTMLVPLLLSNIRNFEHGAAQQRFEQGKRAAEQAERNTLERLRALPDGEAKAKQTKEMIERLRVFAGYREFPKYGMVRRNFAYKQALMREADRLVRAGLLHEREDIFYLDVQELRASIAANKFDQQLIDRRKAEFAANQSLTPSRVTTSEGEIITGSYHRDDFPDAALVGLAVSSGCVEGRARVILDIREANLEPGDILVTAFTDPSWTPLFVAIKGLVTEVGGLMTHGAVIAREYGLPAVVGVENATKRIRDGQRIRVHGTEGYVELLD